MKVLVTGACGFIGSHLVDELIRQKYEVVATDLADAPKTFLNPEAIFIPADLSCKKDVENLFARGEMRWTSMVFHVAAIFDLFPPDSIMLKNNCVGTINLMNAFANHKVVTKRFLLFSSGAIYGDTSPIVSADEKFTLDPKSAYARSKVEQERVLKVFITANPECFDAVILRLAAVIGPRSRYGAAKILEFIAGGQIQFYLGKKKLIAALVHVDDVVGAAIHIGRKPMELLKRVADNETVPVFNIVDNSRYSYEELFDYMASLLEKSHGSRILKFHMPLFLLRLLGKWQEFSACKHKTRPKFAVSLVDFFQFPMTMNNFRLLSAGYELKWPDTKETIKHTLYWYLKEGWI